MFDITQFADITDISNIKLSELSELTGPDGFLGVNALTFERPTRVQVHLIPEHFVYLKNQFNLATEYKKCESSRGPYIREQAELPGNIRIMCILEEDEAPAAILD